MKAYTDWQLDSMTDEDWRAALDAEIAQQDTAEERFGLMLSAMVGDAEMAQMLDTIDYIDDIDDRLDWARGGW